MATDTQDNSIHDEEATPQGVPGTEEVRPEAAAEGRAVPATAAVMETPREARRAKREQARARKRADAAAKRANMAYAEAAAALRALDDASRKVEGAADPAPKAADPAPAEAAPAKAGPAPEPVAKASAAAPIAVAAQPPAPEGSPVSTESPAAPAQAAPASATAVQAAPAPAPQPQPAPAPVVQPAVQAAPAPVAQPVPQQVPAVVPAAVAQPVPVAAQPMPMAAAGSPPVPQYVFVEPPRRTGRTVAIVLVVLVLLAALAAGGWFGYRWLFGPQDALAPEDVPTAMSPIASLSGTPTAKVSLRANADGWSEDKSTPVIVYIRRVDGDASPSSAADAGSAAKAVSQTWDQGEPETAPLRYNAQTDRADITYLAESTSSSAASATSSSSSGAAGASSGSAAASGGYEAYHAFGANVNETISLPPGRYAFAYITPLNEDGSLYKVPEVVDVAVGKDGTALLPVSLEKVAAADVTEEQAKQAAARIRTAMEKGDDSFSSAAFKTSFDKALTQWFAEKLKTEEEKKAEEDKKAEEKKESSSDSASSRSSASSSSNGGNAASSPSAGSTASTPTQTHVHQWVRTDEEYWEPNVVVVSPAYWDNGTYHPAVWEDRGSYQKRPMRHCSGCGTTEAL